MPRVNDRQQASCVEPRHKRRARKKHVYKSTDEVNSNRRSGLRESFACSGSQFGESQLPRGTKTRAFTETNSAITFEYPFLFHVFV